jgi:hypothetical protein
VVDVQLKDVISMLSDLAAIATAKNWSKFVSLMQDADFHDGDQFGFESSGFVEFVDDLRAFLKKAAQCARLSKKA